MAIIYPLTFPTIDPVSAILSMRSIVAVTRSPFTGQEQIQTHQGRLWEMTWSYPPMVRSDAEVLISFLAKLGGREGTFLAGDPNGGTPRGSAASSPGTPLVVGSAQSGTELDIDGVPGGASGYLLQGDYISLGSGVTTHLHKVLEDESADSSGAITLTIWPAIRENPVDGATVVVNSALGHFRLAGNVAEFSINVAQHYGIEFSAVEALRVT